MVNAAICGSVNVAYVTASAGAGASCARPGAEAGGPDRNDRRIFSSVGSSSAKPSTGAADA
jgi:hypothetical protein